MKTVLLAALKYIALQGGTRHPVHLSSQRLAAALDVSQQSGSRYLLSLAQSGHLARRLVRGGQVVTLRPPALAVLRREYGDYRLIFDAAPEVRLIGTLESGLGEGGYYIGQEGYMLQFLEHLGWVPYQGTFNLRIGEEGQPALEALRAAEGIAVEGFQREGRTFGRAQLFRATLSVGDMEQREAPSEAALERSSEGHSPGHACALIMPRRSHYRRVLELISPRYLRRHLGVNDGDRLAVTVRLKGGPAAEDV